MPYTVENQTIFHINRDMPKPNEGNFIMVKKENLERALKDLTPYGAVLYLYLAGNANGYDLAFSPQDVMDRMNIGKTTVHKYINIMNSFKSHLLYSFQIPVCISDSTFRTDVERLSAAPENFILGILSFLCYNQVIFIPVCRYLVHLRAVGMYYHLISQLLSICTDLF